MGQLPEHSAVARPAPPAAQRRVAARAWDAVQGWLTPAAQGVWPAAALAAAWDRIILPDWGPVLVDPAEAILALDVDEPADGPPPQHWVYVPLGGTVHSWSEAVTIRLVADGADLRVQELSLGAPDVCGRRADPSIRRAGVDLPGLVGYVHAQRTAARTVPLEEIAMRRWPIALALFVLSALSLPTRAALAHQLCFGADKTPHCLNDPFSDYWELNGGLPVFGYPVTTAANEPNRDTGQTYLTQWVERNRMEQHPENAGTPYEVLLGLLGKERLVQLDRDYNAEGRESGAQAGCLWFEQTGHNVCDQGSNLGFKTYWETHGLALPGVSTFGRSLQLFGLPLTAPKMETNAAGDTVMTQWFERARFEWHPGNPDQFKVLLGLLGREVVTNAGTQPTPDLPTETPITLPPAPTPPPGGAPGQAACPVLPPASALLITPACVPLGSAFTIRLEGLRPRELVHAYMSDPSGTPFAFPALDGSRVPDFSGVYTLTGALSLDAAPGVYAVTVEDNDYARRRISYIGVYRPAVPPVVDLGKIPTSILGMAEPTSGPIGEKFYFYLDTFLPRESVRTWRVAPNGDYFYPPFETQLGGDGHPIREGLYAPFIGYIDPEVRPEWYDRVGIYQIHYESMDRDRKAVIYIRMTPP